MDLTTAIGRYSARKRGLNVPLRKTGVPAKDFWAYVQKTETCWLWTGALSAGYGHYSMNGRSYRAHRWSWTLANGPIPETAECVMHLCDTPRCVRPDHLQLGTHRDNQADKVAKRRQAIGARVASAVLTEADVLEIRRRYTPRPGIGKLGGNLFQLADEFGVSKDMILHIIHRKAWKHI